MSKSKYVSSDKRSTSPKRGFVSGTVPHNSQSVTADKKFWFLSSIGNNLRQIAALSIIILVSGLVLVPLFKPGFPVTDDGTWMIIRLSAFYQSLKEGQFPVRFLGRLNNDYGYPVANFLYPGFLYIGSAIKLSGLGFVDTVKIIFGGSVFGSGIFIYLWLKRHFGDLSALIGALFFILSPYLLFDIYKRGSVGEVLAMFCISATIYLLDRSRYYAASLMYGLLIISHNTLALFFSIFFSAYIVIFKELKLFKVLIIGLGLSAFFWIPAIVEKTNVRFDGVTISDPALYTINGHYAFLIPVVSVLALIYVIVKDRKKILSFSQGSVYWLFILSLIFASSFSGLIWKTRVVSQLIQFPYRLLVITGFAGAWIVAELFHTVPSKYRKVLIILLSAIMVFQSVQILTSVKYQNYAEGYYTTNEATTTVSDEYMPVWASKVPQNRPLNKIEDLAGAITIKTLKQTTQSLKAELDAKSEARVQINTIYYPGWGVTLDNELQTVYYNNPAGLMQIDVPEGKHLLVAEFRENSFRFITDCITFFTFIIAMSLCLMQIFRDIRGSKYA